MTATPIPRTAAMVVFGDLDMTVIDELPAGPAAGDHVVAAHPARTEAAWARVRSEVAAGHRAFVVCPLVEGSDRVQATSVVAEAERLAGAELAGFGSVCSTDRCPRRRRSGSWRRSGPVVVEVLVATTVIEVGVDITEATVMVIEDADRFGIAQLHQLRGRGGGGSDPSCYLLSDNDTPEAAVRLRPWSGLRTDSSWPRWTWSYGGGHHPRGPAERSQ